VTSFFGIPVSILVPVQEGTEQLAAQAAFEALQAHLPAWGLRTIAPEGDPPQPGSSRMIFAPDRSDRIEKSSLSNGSLAVEPAEQAIRIKGQVRLASKVFVNPLVVFVFVGSVIAAIAMRSPAYAAVVAQLVFVAVWTTVTLGQVRDDFLAAIQPSIKPYHRPNYKYKP
jgi:hypothetical protein